MEQPRPLTLTFVRNAMLFGKGKLEPPPLARGPRRMTLFEKDLSGLSLAAAAAAAKAGPEEDKPSTPGTFRSPSPVASSEQIAAETPALASAATDGALSDIGEDESDASGDDTADSTLSLSRTEEATEESSGAAPKATVKSPFGKKVRGKGKKDKSERKVKKAKGLKKKGKKKKKSASVLASKQEIEVPAVRNERALEIDNTSAISRAAQAKKAPRKKKKKYTFGGATESSSTGRGGEPEAEAAVAAEEETEDDDAEPY